MASQSRYPNKQLPELAIDGGPPSLVAPVVLRHSWPATALQMVATLFEDGRLSHFYGGPLSREFEARFSHAQGMPFGVALNSGTSALHICYRLCGVQPGDEVLIPAHAYVTALSAALELDAIPVLCDVEPGSYGLDPEAVRARLSPRTKVVVPVHLYGRPTNLAAIRDVLSECGSAARIVEDCGQGHGAEIDGRPVGSLGDMSAWSFYEIKHICTGEGGMCLFHSEGDAQRGRSLCHKGKGSGWWDYLEPGFSYPFTELQAAAGLASLDVYNERVAQRRAVEAAYQRILGSAPGLEIPRLPVGSVSGAFKTPLRLTPGSAEKIEWFVEACAAENLPVQRGYPALHRIPWIQERQHRAWNLRQPAALPGDDACLPVSTDLHRRTINVGTGPGIDAQLAERIAHGIRKVSESGLRP